MATIAAYSNSFHGPFVLDDLCSIAENPSIRHLGSLHVLAAPPDAITTHGRPVANLSLAINYALGGTNVVGYHAVNLAIHILAALALFGLSRRTLLLPRLSARFGAASTGLALALALLWAIHPLQTESVTYIVQRVEAIVGLFYLLTLYCLLRGATAVRGSAWYAAAVGACALGMGSKEVMVSAPLVALLYDRLFISGSFREGLRLRWRWYLGLATTWALLGLLVYASRGRSGSAGFGLGMTSWEYGRTQFACIMHYLRLAFWPSNQVLDYGTAVASSAAEIVPYAMGVISLVAATAAALVLRPKWGFLGVWFFAILAPTSSIVPLVGQTEAEHRMYLPLAAVLASVVLAAYWAVGRLGLRSRLAAGALIFAVTAALGWATHQRNKVYQSELAIWDDTVRKCPLNFRAHNNRGCAYVAKGQFDAAIKDFDKAIELKPDFADTYFNRGRAYDGKRQVDAAIEDYGKAVELKPDFAEAYSNRSSAYMAKGQNDAAISDCSKAIELKPDFAEAHAKRGNAYLRNGQYTVAIRDYDRAIELKPAFAEAYNNRAVAHCQTGAYDKAWADVKTFRNLGGTPSHDFVGELAIRSGRSE